MGIRNELLQNILAAIQSGGGVLPSDNCRIGFFDYNDAATATTPISVPGTLTDTPLTNDGLGPGTLTDTPLTNDGLGPGTLTDYRPAGVTDVWDASTNLFDFTGLKNGDMVDIRLDVAVTTTAPNQLVEIDLEVAVGGSSYLIPFVENAYKTAGTHKVSRYNGVYMGDNNTLLNGARFVIRSDAAASCVVNGWYTKVLIRG